MSSTIRKIETGSICFNCKFRNEIAKKHELSKKHTISYCCDFEEK